MKREETMKKGRLSLYVILLISVVAVMIMLKKCSERNADAWVVDNERVKSGGDTIDVAIEYSPLNIYRNGDTISGFNYELLEALADRGNLKIKYHPISSLGKALKDVDDDYIRIVVSDIPVSSEMKEKYSYTQAVFLDRQVLIQKRDSAGAELPIKSQLDLASRDVWAVKDSPVVERLRNLGREIGDTIFIHEDPEYGAEQLFIMVAIGEIPCCVINERTAQKLKGDYPLVDISTGVSFTQFQSWVLKKDDDKLLHLIDSLLTKFKEEKAYQNLVDKYFR